MILPFVRARDFFDEVNTWAAITRCLSAIKLHLLQLQSLNWQCLLCPFNHEINPWFRHRAHLGRRADDSFSSTKSSALAVMEVLILLLFILFLWRSGDKWDVNLDDVDVIHTHHHKWARSGRRGGKAHNIETKAGPIVWLRGRSFHHGTIY